MNERPETVLVVEADGAERSRIRHELGQDGFRVFVCPGPGGFIRCPVSYGSVCNLVAHCDVVVLDPALAGEGDLDGVSPIDLLSAYVGEKKPIVVTSRTTGGVRPYLDEKVRIVTRPAPGPEIHDAIRSLLDD